MPHTTVREALVLVCLSLLLGLGYNASAHKGIFSSAKPSHSAPLPANTVAPEIISIERAKELFDATGAVFVDSRHAFDYTLGHIAGAISLPLADTATVIPSLTIPRDTEIIVYCDGADCNSSLEIGSKLAVAGFSRVRVFFGGWQEWKNAGYPVEGTNP